MPKAEKNLSVCKRCGAVGSVKQSHCVLCGAALDSTMVLRTGEKRVKIDISGINGTIAAGIKRKKITLFSTLSLLLGIIAAVLLMLPLPFSGVFFGIAAVIFAVLSFVQGKGGTFLSVIGMVLGVYTLFVNLFYFLWQIFYLFID